MSGLGLGTRRFSRRSFDILAGALAVGPAITATVVPATSALVVGQSLQDTTNWLTFLGAANYATSAAGATISTVVVNYVGDTATAAEAFVDGDANHFSITVTDSLGNSQTFQTTPRTVVHAAPSGSIAIDSLSYSRGAAGIAPDLNSTVSDTGTTAGNYTMVWATRSTGTALSKSAIENGTGDALDSGSVTAATLDALDAPLDLSTSLTNGAIDAFIRDGSSTPVESAVASATGVNYDAAAPVFASAEVGTIDATSLVVTFDKALYGSTSATDWDVQVAGSPATESAASVSGSTVDITLGAAVTEGQVVTVAYTGTGLVGIDAEQAATFTAQSVTNNVTAASANLFTAPNDFTNPAWDATDPAMSASDADTLSYAGGGAGTPAFQEGVVVSGGAASKTFTITADVSGSGVFRFKNTHGGVADNFSSDITLTGTPTTRTFAVTNSASAGNGSQFAGFARSAAGATAFTLNVSNLKLEES